MTKLTVVVGLPGSGKSHYLQQDHGWRYYDDFRGKALDNCPSFSCARHFVCLIELLRSGLDWAISDIGFCEDDARDEIATILKTHRRCCPHHPRLFEGVIAGLPQVEIDWVFFENAPDKCRRNVGENPKRLADIDRYSKVYKIPKGMTTLKVWERV